MNETVFSKLLLVIKLLSITKILYTLVRLGISRSLNVFQ